MSAVGFNRSGPGHVCLALGRRWDLRNFVDEHVTRMMPGTLSHWSNHDQNKAMIRTVRDSLKSSLSNATIKDLRNNTADAMVAWLSSGDGARFVFQGIQSRGASSRDALRLAVTPSAIGGFMSGMAAMALYWLAFGGFDAAKSKSVTNDFHDLEYAILGAISDSLLTVDERLKVNRSCRGSDSSCANCLRRLTGGSPEIPSAPCRS